MGRPPINERAMTPAERQRKRRERLGIGGPYLRAFLPWMPPKLGKIDPAQLTKTRREAQLFEELDRWLRYGDKDSVTNWIAASLEDREESLEDLLALIREKAEMRMAEYE